MSSPAPPSFECFGVLSPSNGDVYQYESGSLTIKWKGGDPQVKIDIVLLRMKAVSNPQYNARVLGSAIDIKTGEYTYYRTENDMDLFSFRDEHLDFFLQISFTPSEPNSIFHSGSFRIE